VVIATVFLTIIGMTAGYVLGERHRRDGQSQSAGQESTAGTGQGALTSGSTAAPEPTISGTPCPDAAQQAAAARGVSGLSQILMIRTANHSTVWICEDPSGQLYYQSHTRVNGQDAPLAQNVNGLFLPGVTSTDAGYVVFDQKHNKFTVTRKHLQITFAATGKVETDDVDTAVG
jgi:hypothetical protein